MISVMVIWFITGSICASVVWYVFLELFRPNWKGREMPRLSKKFLEDSAKHQALYYGDQTEIPAFLKRQNQ